MVKDRSPCEKGADGDRSCAYYTVCVDAMQSWKGRGKMPRSTFKIGASRPLQKHVALAISQWTRSDERLCSRQQ